MKSKNSKDSNIISNLEIKSILKKKFINRKIKALEIKFNSYNKLNTKLNQKFFNERNQNNKYGNLDTEKYNNIANTEYLKIKLEGQNKIFPYKNKKKKNKNNPINKFKFIYNNKESNNNLKKYTNNSASFQIFELNNSYHKYSVNKIEKSILLKTPNIQNHIQNKNQIINLFNLPNIKEIPKSFIKLPPIKIQKLMDLNINDSDSELNDKIDNKMIENEKLKQKIRVSLLQDINPEEKNYKLYLNYLRHLPNHFNYFEDIYMIPHIKNNLALGKSFDLDNLKIKLCDKNLLHKKVVLSMNRIIIIRALLIKKQKEMEKKQTNEEIKEKSILRWNYIGEQKLNQYEQLYEKFELQDYFEKCTNNQIISFSNKKLKSLVFTSKRFYEK